MKCFLSSGYTEEPEVLKTISCDKGAALNVVFRDLPITPEDKIEVVICLPDSDIYMTSARYERRVIGTNTATGVPIKGIVVSPHPSNKPFPPGTKIAIVRAQPDAELGAKA